MKCRKRLSLSFAKRRALSSISAPVDQEKNSIMSSRSNTRSSGTPTSSPTRMLSRSTMNVSTPIVVMNAFEHYREPHKVAAELHRILKPGGRIDIRTAFLQPLHEKPWHFFNCTRYGLAEWFKSFETERLHVSKNFCPNHTMAWIASELEAAFRKDVSPAVADAFRSASIGDLVDLWRDPSKRDAPLWTDFERIPQTDQEVTAAGFELIGRRPRDLPNLKA